MLLFLCAKVRTGILQIIVGQFVGSEGEKQIWLVCRLSGAENDPQYFCCAFHWDQCILFSKIKIETYCVFQHGR